MKKIVVATANQHKVKEFIEILKPFGYIVQSLLDFDEIPIIEETGSTFSENAYIKAKMIYDQYHIPVVADDSGIEIDFYDGKPGVYSHRFLGEDTAYDIKNKIILEEMAESENREARFVCVLAYIDEQGDVHYFEGEIKGTISYEIIGEYGFGYDPIFYYEPFHTTLANVSQEKKASVSHRGKAVEQFLHYLSEEKL